MMRFCFIIIAVMAINKPEIRLCNGAVIRPVMPMACFEESDEETFVDIMDAPASVATAGSVSLDKILKSKLMLDYLSKREVIRRAVYGSTIIGCPPSVLIAQDALESNFNKSSLVLKTNNSGNVKCRCNGNRKLRAKHIAEGRCVAGYDKIEKSNDRYVKFKTNFEGWAKKVKTLANYKVVRNAKKNQSAEAWCMVFCRSPYATDRRYGKKLIKAINDYDLKSLDTAIAKGLTITSSSGKYVFFEGKSAEPNVEQSVSNFITFPDQTDTYESADHRKAKRQAWKDFIKKNKGHALMAQDAYQVPASVVLGLMLMETNCGYADRAMFMSRAKSLKKKKSYIDYAEPNLIHVIEDMELYNLDK